MGGQNLAGQRQLCIHHMQRNDKIKGTKIRWGEESRLGPGPSADERNWSGARHGFVLE